MSTPSLFEPFTLGRAKLASRLVMNPMTRSRADAEGLAGPLMAEYYGQRASAGLIVTEGVAPSPDGKGYARIPGLWSPRHAESWKPVTSAVHAKGGRIFVQLMHCGRIAHPLNLPAGARVVAPSALRAPGQIHTDAQGMQPHGEPVALDGPGVEAAKAAFVEAARLAVEAGFDGVELHAANGYLLEQFLSPVTNRRDDAWGGDLGRRLRFVLETARGAAAAIGADRVGIRVSPYGVNGGMEPYAEVDDTYRTLARELSAAGLAYLHVVDHSAMGAPPVPEALKADLRREWKGALILAGGFDRASADRALAEGRADLIGVGRPFISNPDLPRRWREGLPLNAPDMGTFFTPGPKGYTDYPAAA